MKSYEIFTDKFSQVIQANNIVEAMENFDVEHNLEITSVRIADWLPSEGDRSAEDAHGFAEFAASGFWFNHGDSDLWESFTEGEQFEVNGQMQFRFTTEELYSVYKSRSV